MTNARVELEDLVSRIEMLMTVWRVSTKDFKWECARQLQLVLDAHRSSFPPGGVKEDARVDVYARVEFHDDAKEYITTIVDLSESPTRDMTNGPCADLESACAMLAHDLDLFAKALNRDGAA